MRMFHVFAVVFIIASSVFVAGCSTSDAGLKQQGFEVVDSTLIEGIKYDATARILSIAFDTGDIYDYLNVPEKVYQALMAAESKGQYFHAQIKEKFKYTKR